MKNTLIGIVVVGAVLGTIAFFNVSPFRSAVQSAFGSAAGSTFSTAKFAGVVVSLTTAGASATSTSILNTDAYDRYVSEFKVGCEKVGTSYVANTGAGLASWQISVGTTTTASPAAFSSFAAVATNFVLSTSSTNVLAASSTLATGSQNATIWPTNTYMTFAFNATNTAACTVGVSYFGS